MKENIIGNLIEIQYCLSVIKEITDKKFESHFESILERANKELQHYISTSPSLSMRIDTKYMKNDLTVAYMWLEHYIMERGIETYEPIGDIIHDVKEEMWNRYGITITDGILGILADVILKDWRAKDV